LQPQPAQSKEFGPKIKSLCAFLAEDIPQDRFDPQRFVEDHPDSGAEAIYHTLATIQEFLEAKDLPKNVSGFAEELLKEADRIFPVKPGECSPADAIRSEEERKSPANEHGIDGAGSQKALEPKEDPAGSTAPETPGPDESMTGNATAPTPSPSEDGARRPQIKSDPGTNVAPAGTTIAPEENSEPVLPPESKNESTAPNGPPGAEAVPSEDTGEEKGEPIKGGYVLLPCKLLTGEVMDTSPLVLKLWVWMLLQASPKNHGTLKRGRFFTRVKDIQEAMAYRVGFRIKKPTIKEIRSAMDILMKGGMMDTMKGTHGQVITIKDYDLYQNPANYEGHTE
jgi:hypothetical protein